MPIVCKDLSFRYGEAEVFAGFNAEFHDQKVTAVLGPSGCGKTTLLHLISGLLDLQGGSLEGAEEERISYLFQEPRLLPWRTIRKNIEMVLAPSFEAGERNERALHFLELVGLRDFEHYFPNQLSGGMRQRAAVARAFAYPAGIMLMDEPLQALDLLRKQSLIDQFEGLWEQDPRTTIFVTHDVQEALLLGDSIMLLDGPPAHTRKILVNPLPHQDRYLHARALMELEREMYGLLLEKGGRRSSD
jgi:NitT/TauT family transport system ATP-binding protein